MEREVQRSSCGAPPGIYRDARYARTLPSREGCQEVHQCAWHCSGCLAAYLCMACAVTAIPHPSEDRLSTDARVHTCHFSVPPKHSCKLILHGTAALQPIYYSFSTPWQRRAGSPDEKCACEVHPLHHLRLTPLHWTCSALTLREKAIKATRATYYSHFRH